LTPLSLSLAAAILFAVARQGQDARLSGPIPLHLENWEARVAPETLAVNAKLRGREGEVVIADGGGRNFSVSDLTASSDSVRWTIPELGVGAELRAIRNHLNARFTAGRELKFIWPVTGRDPAMSALIYPDGEGLYIPLDDGFWNGRLSSEPCRDTSGGLSMPFWSYGLSGGTVTYLAVSDLETQLCVSSHDGRLSTYAVHDFRERDGYPPYEIEIWPGGPSPVSPAVEYRQWLIDHGRYVTLEQKTRGNPEVGKLLGAAHAYVFGDGRTIEFLETLKRLGIDRFWLGYDQDPRQQNEHLVYDEYIAEAKRLGYLIGPYDTFDNIQDPRSADAVSSIWDPDLYKAGCIVDEQGETQRGFQGRGCELSSEALNLAEARKHTIEDRVAGHARTGINSYFLDSDAYGDLYDDYSKTHPMTRRQDRLNRLRRMRYISETRRLVLGSEGGVGWSVPVLDFAHGTEAVSNELLWAIQKDRQSYGGWWPPARPAIFFKRVAVSPEFKKARYDPVYRLPLYQAAFHGSVVTTDRWETPLLKFPEVVQTRTLLELLYNVPSMWSLDLSELRQDRATLAALYRFFSPLHRQIGDKTLSDFEWLTPDRKVQQTRFGSEIQLTANFGRTQYRSVPPMCIEAQWLKEGRKQLFCPKA
jgi:glycosyl hydrolase family 129